MTTLLMVEDEKHTMREFFELYDEDLALDELDRFVVENKNLEISLYEVSPDHTYTITDGNDRFTSAFKRRESGSKDIWCDSCGYIMEAVTQDEIEQLPIKTYIKKFPTCDHIHFTTYCKNCIGHMEVAVMFKHKRVKLN